MLTGRHFAILALTSLTCHGAPADAPSIPPMTELQRREALFLDSLSVPSPGEVFAALNRACRPNWASLVAPATAPLTTVRPQLALAVGVLAANGYIAVEAQDGQQVKNIGREMMAEAKALGVSQSLLTRGNSLIEFANSNSWDALADELEATENEVKATMVEQKDHDLVTLTSAAAWLRGLEVASGVVLASDSLQGAQALRQPDLALQLADRLANLPARISTNPLVIGVKQALESTAALLQSDHLTEEKNAKVGKMDKENKAQKELKEREALQKIHDNAASIVKLILTSTTVSPVAAIPPAAPPAPPAASASPSPRQGLEKASDVIPSASSTPPAPSGVTNTQTSPASSKPEASPSAPKGGGAQR